MDNYTEAILDADELRELATILDEVPHSIKVGTIDFDMDDGSKQRTIEFRRSGPHNEPHIRIASSTHEPW